ncbi:hypothetical protein AB1L05_16725 [Cytobacillus horneckiae]
MLSKDIKNMILAFLFLTVVIIIGLLLQYYKVPTAWNFFSW